jgi:ankyrin repeat protein
MIGRREEVRCIEILSHCLPRRRSNCEEILSHLGTRREFPNPRAQKPPELATSEPTTLIYKDNSGQTALSWAAEDGRATSVKLLLSGSRVDPDSRNAFERTPLFWAVAAGHEQVVDLLLANGADPESRDSGGHTPLLEATRRGHDRIFTTILASTDVSRQYKDTREQMQLVWAAESGNESEVKVFLNDKKAIPNLKNIYIQQSFSNAAFKGYVEVVRLLLQNTTKDNLRDCDFNKPLQEAN